VWENQLVIEERTASSIRLIPNGGGSGGIAGGKVNRKI